jgi:hypothetical protein
MEFGGFALTPQELELVQGIFKAIVAEPWFTRSRENERDFAKLILLTYREGITDPERLMNCCRAAAETRFGS